MRELVGVVQVVGFLTAVMVVLSGVYFLIAFRVLPQGWFADPTVLVFAYAWLIGPAIMLLSLWMGAGYFLTWKRTHQGAAILVDWMDGLFLGLGGVVLAAAVMVGYYNVFLR